MFKFIKNNFLDPIRKGVEEGRQEMQAEKEVANIEAMEHIATISYDEKFATALAAPFRVVIFGDWFTVFKDNGTNDDRCSIHLFTFGEGIDVSPENIKDLKESLMRDFGIHDEKSALCRIGSFFHAAQIPCEIDFPLDLESFADLDMQLIVSDEVKTAFYAMFFSMTAYIATSCADVSYLSKADAMKILIAISTHVRTFCNSWGEYSSFFIKGESLGKLNHSVGRKLLEKYVGYLNTKPGSPWNMVEWTECCE